MATNNAVNNGLSGATGTINFVGSTAPTITTPTLINAAVSGGFLDTNGVTFFSMPTLASSVNFFAFNTSTTGNAVVISSAGSDSNIILQLAGKGTGNVQIGGTKAADNANTGFVGEYVSSNIPNASAITLMANTATDLTSISLTAGDWDIVGNVYFQPTGIIETLTGWISITSATSPDASNVAATLTAAAANGIGFCVPTLRVNVSTTTTVYLSALSSSTPKVCGTIQARRRR